ncbi:MAG: bifunctional UDP-N-acetylglucosamine diphosphorylase/glucosamine-1-phosphate N-acetyltransferase GlmU [Gammaproteobacteria bacterium]
MSLNVVILAAGQGTRMRSKLPKVLHQVGGKSMLAHTVVTAENLGADRIIVVYGHGGEAVHSTIQNEKVEWVEQSERLGTGHAVQQAIPFFTAQSDENILILYGDVPLVRESTLLTLVEQKPNDSMAILTTELANPQGYGRIVRSAVGKVEKIVEEKDADDDIRQIAEINTGILCASSQSLINWLNNIDNNNQQQEYYLTDCVGLAVAEGKSVEAVICKDPTEVMGVNNRVHLADMENVFQAREREKLMINGATLRDTASIFVEGNVEIGNDIIIEANVLLRGNVTIGDDVTIGMNSVITDSVIEAGTVIHPNSVIEDSNIGENCEIGPFARVRPGTELASKVKLGNFVEVKKSNIATGSKVNHLSYIGDANIGEKTNIGAGTICCNYDGANKHKTIIGNNVFIGSDTQLVAPVTIDDGATIGAGSTITRDVPAEKLTLSRSKQTTIDNWQRPNKQKK